VGLAPGCSLNGMARKTKIVTQSVTVVVDDYTGKEISEKDAQRVTLTYKGITHHADLSRASVKALDKALNAFFGNVNPYEDSKGNPELIRVRQWAAENGYFIGVKGLIPPDVQSAYDAAHA
jgi:hypothetical protein